MEVVRDKALLRRIWAPIDVLDDASREEPANAWILLLASRSLNYIRHRAAFLKADEDNTMPMKMQWYRPLPRASI